MNESGTEVPVGQEGILALVVKPTYPVGLFRGTHFKKYNFVQIH